LRFLKGCGSFDTLNSGIARLVGGAFYGVRLIKDKIGFSSEHKDKITLLSPHEITTKALMADRHGQSATVCYLKVARALKYCTTPQRKIRHDLDKLLVGG
jgi:hypothetical protein